MKEVVFRGGRKFEPWRPLQLILSRYIRGIARKHIGSCPQVAIFSFDYVGLKIIQEGRYERDLLDVLVEFLVASDKDLERKTVIDIGANMGNHSLFFAQHYKHVYSFEPNPRTFKLLEVNSEGRNITALNVALGNENGSVPLLVNISNMGASRIVDSPTMQRKDDLLWVDVERLDDINVVAGESIGLIKIDVEGHELRVLQGATATMLKDRPIVLFEQHREDIRDGSSDAIEFLSDLGYSFRVVERSFDFGEAFVLRMVGHFLRALFGSRMKLVKKERFDRRLYELIVAVPRNARGSDKT